jgi:hypothetical protein
MDRVAVAPGTREPVGLVADGAGNGFIADGSK